jgi:large subunit ribosomal protein L15e
MGLYKHLSQLMRKGSQAQTQLQKDRLVEWRAETTPLRIEHPTNLVAAKHLGYVAKPGIVVVRVRLFRGQKERPTINKGRRSAHMRQRLVLKKSLQWVAEERAAKEYVNMEVLNSYNVGKDGLHAWYEVILVDPRHPAVMADDRLNWIINTKNRVFHGKTSAGQKSRGLRGKGQGHERFRPSENASLKRRKGHKFYKR